MPVPAELRAAAMVSKAWPYEEARKLLKRYPDGPPPGGIVFETGYGPSGLPHLGTFQEVARTLMVRHALSELVDWPSRLIAFSDDMDGMRKVPPGVPHQDMMHEHLDQAAVPWCRTRSAAAMRAMPITITACCASSSTASASIMNSSPRPNCYAFGPLRRSAEAACCAITTRSWGSCCRPSARSGARAIRRCFRSARRAARCSRSPIEVVDAEAGLIAFEDEGERIEQIDPRRQRQAAMEGRLGDALGRARRRL